MKYAPSLFLFFAFQSPKTLVAQQFHLRNENDAAPHRTGATTPEEGSSSSVPPSHGIKSRHLIDEDVCVPEEVYYVADIEISTIPETNPCTKEDITGVVEYIDQRFKEYSTLHEVLGPLDIEQFGSSCDIEYFQYTGVGGCAQFCAAEDLEDRRRLRARNGGGATIFDDPRDAPKNTRELFLYHEGVPKLSKGSWVYTNGATCRFCTPDNKDRRKLRTQEAGNKSVGRQFTTQTDLQERHEPPANQGQRMAEAVGSQQVLIRLATDDKPWETSYSVSEVGGPQVHFKGGSFSNNDDTQQEIIHLEKGKQYTFDIYDSQGDGFGGDGGVVLFFGGLEFRVPFGEIHGNFGVHQSIKFTANGLADAAGTETDPKDPFPTLQHDISEQISLSVRRKFHNDPTHCLHNTNPSVWVNLSTATKEEARTACSPSIFSWPPPPNPVTAAAPPPPNPAVTPSPPTTPASANWEGWTLSNDKRCGSNEPDARGNCGITCSNAEDCPIPGHWCFGVHDNYCGSKPQPAPTGDCPPKRRKRCGVSELHARETCGKKCKLDD